MKHLVKILSLALCAAVLLSLPALAAEGDLLSSSAPEDPTPPETLAPVSVWGKVTRLESGSLLITSTEEDAVNQETIVHLPEGTPCVDAATGLPLDMAKVKDGDILYAWVGNAMTMSLPPQTSAIVVVGNVKSGGSVPQYYEITGSDGWAVTADQDIPRERTICNFPVAGGETLEIPVSAQFTPWLTRQMVNIDSLIPGSQILVWRDKEGKTERVILFPYGYRGYLSTQSWDGKLSVNGQALEAKGIPVEHWWDPQYVPLRSIAEAAGYDVSWVRGQGAVVKEGEKVLFSVLPGSETVKRPENEDGDWELAAPCMIKEGVTYLPVRELAMLLNLYICNT